MANRAPSGKHIFLIGPGGVGKTTLGPHLAKRLELGFVDLDQEFCDRIENIGTYIGTRGYLAYVNANSGLLGEILKEVSGKPSVIPVSSGFLASDSPDRILVTNLARCFSGIPVLLLPSPDMEVSTGIVVDRLAKRHGEFGFRFETNKAEAVFRVRAAQTFAKRFDEYLSLDCVTVFSCQKPELIAEDVIRELAHA